MTVVTLRLVAARVRGLGLGAFCLIVFCSAAWAADLEALHAEAERGGTEAQFQLGTAYLSGSSTEKDAAKALTWLTKAARAGHAGAQYALGDMHAAGRGVVADRVEAYFWFNIAARNGSDAAAARRDAIGGELTSSEFFGIQARVREWTDRSTLPTPGAIAT